MLSIAFESLDFEVILSHIIRASTAKRRTRYSPCPTHEIVAQVLSPGGRGLYHFHQESGRLGLIEGAKRRDGRLVKVARQLPAPARQPGAAVLDKYGSQIVLPDPDSDDVRPGTIAVRGAALLEYLTDQAGAARHDEVLAAFLSPRGTFSSPQAQALRFRRGTSCRSDE